MPRYLKTLFVTLISAFALSGCTLVERLGLHDADPGQSLAPGERVTLHFFTKIPNFDSGVALQAGVRYELDVVLLSNWVDSYIAHNDWMRISTKEASPIP